MLGLETRVAATAAVVGALLFAPAQAFAQGDTCSNAQHRAGASAHLPDCRAYEQVSPVDKNGSDIDYGTPGVSFGPLPISPSGDTAFFRSLGAFAGTTWGGGQQLVAYASRRGEDGWDTQPMSGRPEPAGAINSLVSIRPDYGAGLIRGGGPITADPAPFGGLYMRDLTTRQLSFMVASSGASAAQQPGSPFVWAPNSSFVTFASAQVLAAGAPAAQNKAYKYQNGAITLVSVLPGEVPAIGQVGSFGTTNAQRSLSNAVSANGEHIFFTNPLGSGLTATHKIYRRTGSTATQMVTPSKRTDCAGDPTCGGDSIPTPAPDPAPGGKQFLTATPDGNRVFFTSPELLTDDANTGAARTSAAPRDLYRYDVAADELIDISADDSTPDGARVEGVLGASQDGDSVYFVAHGQLVPGEGVDGSPNLYLWRDDGTADGDTTYIATLAAADSSNWSWSDSKTSRITPDGRHLVFASALDLTAHPNAGTTLTKVFHYEASPAGGAGDLECVSCNPAGAPPAGPADLGEAVGTGIEEPDQYMRLMTDDGSRIFFNSRDALVPEDTNGVRDAYMWEDGAPRLLSSGKSPHESRFYGASSEGDEAFILSRERLVGWDGDNAQDLYVAKVGGGFPEPVAPVLCSALADACQGPAAGAPSPISGATTTPPATGDAPAEARQRLSIRQPSARSLRRAAKRGVLVLRLRAAESGRVTATARARIRGAKRRVGRARKDVVGQRAAQLRIRLSRAARGQLRAGRPLRLTLRVTAPGARERTLNVALRRVDR